jgi:hypothetical protein
MKRTKKIALLFCFRPPFRGSLTKPNFFVLLVNIEKLRTHFNGSTYEKNPSFSLSRFDRDLNSGNCALISQLPIRIIVKNQTKIPNNMIQNTMIISASLLLVLMSTMVGTQNITCSLLTALCLLAKCYSNL